jgi:predicted O-linked N-acetylglucosamine transferase (SPINDLY family)
MDMMAKLNEGIQFHLRGDYKAAELSYLDVLSVNPGHPDAHNLLANLYNRLGDRMRALYHANQAVASNRIALYLNTRGLIFNDLKRYQEAVADLRAALKLEPSMADAHCNLSVAYRHTKDLKRAIESARRALALQPALAEAWINLGTALEDKGEGVEAVQAYHEALRITPAHPIALANLGKLQYRLGEYAAAAEAFEACVRHGVDDLELRFVYAHTLSLSGGIAASADVLEEGFASCTDFSPLKRLLPQDALFGVLFKVCIYLGNVLGVPERAIALYRRCLEVAPSAALCINLGTIYFNRRQLPLAIETYTQGLALDPNLFHAYNNIGVCHQALSNPVEAIRNFEKALEIAPDFSPALGGALDQKAHICDWAGFDDVRRRVARLVHTTNTTPISPFVALAVFEDPAELRHWATLASNELFASVNGVAPCELKPRRKHKKIRLGYYSYDFRDHPVAHLTARLFELHNRDFFDIYAYSYGPDDGCEARKRIQAASKHFVDVRDLSVVDTARRIAEDDIDFLIDLTANTANTRSQVFALRPARLQAHWLGFVGTMGSPHYDYVLADDIVAPAGDEPFFAEKILRLPGGMHVMDDSRVIDGRGQARAANGLPEKGVVFGCFCQTFKIQPEMFARWMDILRDVPGSVLWLASAPAGAVENLREAARRHAVDPDRLVVAQRCGMEEYLGRLTLVDLLLDTFPYTSGTVASDALIAGCPLLTLSGRSMVSRMAGSILSEAGLPELVCQTGEDYVALALRLGNSPDELTILRGRLAEARQSAPLFNMAKAVRGLEDAIALAVKGGGKR